MSLRDQLVAKGLVSKKRARKVERQLRDERRAEQGSRRKKRDLEREAQAREAAASEARTAQRVAEAKDRAERKQAIEDALRIRNLLLGNRLRPGRGHRFWHRSPDGQRLSEIDVSSGIAFQLRCGEVALAHLQHTTWSEIIVVPRTAAHKLLELAPETLVFFVEDPTGISAPDLAFHRRDWETEIGPHRATDDDLLRLRDAR